jgi:hypothetical protein
MPQSPLGNLPLRVMPYNSRITTEYSSEKNYYLIAFNPGYSLQASELNEIQELFFLNQSLSLRMNGLWQSNGYKVPFWNGTIPLNPNDVTVAGVATINPATSTPIGTATVTVQSGWFLWTDGESKLSFWLHLPEEIIQSVQTSGALTEYVGFEVEKTQIICCPTNSCEETQDPDLRDNSQGNSENFFTCGASRLKASIPTELVVRDELSDTFYPLLRITIALGTNGQYATTVGFADGQNFINNG